MTLWTFHKNLSSLKGHLSKQNILWSILFCCFSAFPDVESESLTADHEFVVLACDGIWDVMTNEEVVEFVRGRIAQQMLPEIVSSENLFI